MNINIDKDDLQEVIRLLSLRIADLIEDSENETIKPKVREATCSQLNRLRDIRISLHNQRVSETTSIFIEWCVGDVQEVRPDLNDEQASEVLEFVKDKHDATIGISWDTLSYAADHLYPKA